MFLILWNILYLMHRASMRNDYIKDISESNFLGLYLNLQEDV